MNKFPKPISKEEETELAKLGTVEARHKLIETVLAYAIHLVNKHIALNPYKWKWKDDLIQEASLAVVEMLGDFDPVKGRLTTFITAKVIRKILEYNERLIYLPDHPVKYCHPDLLGHCQTFQSDGAIEIAQESETLDQLIKKEEIELLYAAISSLSEMQRNVLTRRLKDESVSSIAKSISRSQERVRQIETQARVKIFKILKGHTDASSTSL